MGVMPPHFPLLVTWLNPSVALFTDPHTNGGKKRGGEGNCGPRLYRGPANGTCWMGLFPSRILWRADHTILTDVPKGRRGREIGGKATKLAGIKKKKKMEFSSCRPMYGGCTKRKGNKGRKQLPARMDQYLGQSAIRVFPNLFWLNWNDFLPIRDHA